MEGGEEEELEGDEGQREGEEENDHSVGRMFRSTDHSITSHISH